jgi:hypothetical protein
MIEPVNTQKPLFPACRVAELPRVMFCGKEKAEHFGRRLITLLCAGWVPHDIVFVAEYFYL